jgi:hypothetical protein
MTIDRSLFCFYHWEGHNIVALIDLCVFGWLERLSFDPGADRLELSVQPVGTNRTKRESIPGVTHVRYWYRCV